MRPYTRSISFFIVIVAAIIISSCAKNDNDPVVPVAAATNTTVTTTTNTGGTTTNAAATTSSSVPSVYTKLYGATNVYVDGDYIVIKSTGEPDHKSPYFATTSSKYVNDTRTEFKKAPSSTISTFSYTFKIPKNPTAAATHKTLGAATIGVAINGVPFFNQYQAQNQLITTTSGEYQSFDLYGGHPTPFNEYHYHIEPNYLTTLKGKSALMGFMLDGFPIYGPLENNKTLKSSDLDAYHGHTHATTDYPNGIYHYHITADAPYLNGNGYYGTAGTWSK